MAKLKVYGRVRDRIVLGIANGYLTLHPNTSLDELNEAFPNKLNSLLKEGNIFRNAGETNGMVSCGKKPSQGIINLANGKRIEMVVQWTDEDYSELKEWVRKDGIEVEEPQKDMKIPKEGYWIERLESFSTETRKEEKRRNRDLTNNQRHMMYLLLTLLLLFSILLFSRGNTNDADDIIRYRNLHQTERTIDLHQLAIEQKRKEKEKETQDFYHDEEVRLAREFAENTKVAFDALAKQ